MDRLSVLKNALSKARRRGYNLSDDSIHWGHIIDGKNFYSIIFDKEFAEALWGGDFATHLQRMVIDDDPVGYLQRNYE